MASEVYFCFLIMYFLRKLMFNDLNALILVYRGSNYLITQYLLVPTIVSPIEIFSFSIFLALYIYYGVDIIRVGVTDTLCVTSYKHALVGQPQTFGRLSPITTWDGGVWCSMTIDRCGSVTIEFFLFAFKLLSWNTCILIKRQPICMPDLIHACAHTNYITNGVL
jgi:hypothetical protein